LGRGTDDTVRFLLEPGAEPNTGVNGLHPFHSPITTSSHVKAELLLQYRLDVTGVDDERGYNVLHCLAYAGDVDMRISTGMEFGGYRYVPSGCDGVTPLDVLNERDPGSEVREVFHQLLESVEKQNRANMSVVEDVDGSGSDGEMEFFDAEDGVDKDVGGVDGHGAVGR